MSLVKNQMRLLQQAIHGVKRHITSSIHTAIVDLQEMQVSRRIKKNLIGDILHKQPILEEFESSVFPAEPVRISFLAATRRLDNPNHRLKDFLTSLIVHAKDISRIEVLLAVDSDDDIQHYMDLKRKYGNRLRFRIFVSPVRYGYRGLHRYDRFLIPHMAAGSRMMCDYSDDCTIVLEHFDEELMAIDARHSDNLYFVHTNPFNWLRNEIKPVSEIATRARYLGDVSKEPLRLFWTMQARRPASYFPIVSRGVLDCAYEALKALPEDQREEWSPFANAWICDCYLDILSTFVKANGLDRIYSVPMTQIHGHNIYAGYQHKSDEYGMTAANQAFQVMLSGETQRHLRYIADVVVQHARPDAFDEARKLGNEKIALHSSKKTRYVEPSAAMTG